MILLVAEKPSVATDHYQKMLIRQEGEKFVKKDGYLLGERHCITWCVGHLVTLAQFDSYEGYSGSWKLGNLPLLPSDYKLNVIERTQKQYKIVQNLMKHSAVLVNGADAGREGNLIFDLVVDNNSEFSGKEIKRLWVNSFVDKDLDKAWKNLELGTHRANLSSAARLRQRADWLVGLNATRAYTLTAGHGRLISVGRVQTPTLNLVVQRDTDVESFSEFYVYGVEAVWKGLKTVWLEEGKVAWPEEKALADRVVKKTNQKEATLNSAKKATKKSFAPRPFDLTELQKEANKKLKFKAAQTLEIAQKLYEKKFISYPRTDSSYINDTMKPETYSLAMNLATPEQKALFRPESDNFTFVNSKKVTDHYAILPTTQEPHNVSVEEKRLYDLIRERFLLAWLEPQIWFELTVEIECEEVLFRTKLKQESQKGWKSLKSKNKQESSDEKNEAEEEDSAWVDELPKFEKGEKAILNPVELKPKKKSKPKYYTEATLLQAMKTAGRTIEDEELADAMKERGLGTPATQAGILETLKKRGFLIEEKGHLCSSPQGRQLISQVEENLKSPVLTGEWEYKLKQVEKGELTPTSFHQDIQEYVKGIFTALRAGYSVDFEREEVEFTKPCLKCGSELERQNWGLTCSKESCDFKFGFSVAGRALSPDEIEKLWSGEALEELSGFKSKKGFDFSAGLKLNDSKELEIVFKEDPARAFKEKKGKCPACKGAMSENARMIRCEGDRCPFVLWKVIAKKELDTKTINTLLKKKKTELIEGFTSKKGSAFSACLEMGADLKVKFVFEDSKVNSNPQSSKGGLDSNYIPPANSYSQANVESIALSCPACKSGLKVTKDRYYCDVPQCAWIASKVTASREISLDELKRVLENSKSDLLDGFVGKTGQKFKACLKLDEKMQVKFDLESIVKY